MIAHLFYLFHIVQIYKALHPALVHINMISLQLDLNLFQYIQYAVDFKIQYINVKYFNLNG